MRTTHLLYLHGFRSSPRSAKAVQVGQRVARTHTGVTWWCPQLPPSPAQAMALIRQGTAHWPVARMAVVGSSLGGFYATRLAVDRGCRAVLLNPAVQPARDLAVCIGEQTAWHDPQERFFFRPEFVDQLQALTGGELPMPQQGMAVIAKGDELLDWREMVGGCVGAHIQLLTGGDHALGDFGQHLGAVTQCLYLSA